MGRENIQNTNKICYCLLGGGGGNFSLKKTLAASEDLVTVIPMATIL